MSPSPARRARIRLALGWILPLLALPPLLIGCGRRPPPQEEGSLPFVFRSLNLRQQDPQGRPSWELSSPEARYDLRRRVAQASQPRGVIYAKGQPLYRVAAESGTVINDGEVILLEGRIRVEQLRPQPVLIRASRVRWMPARELMEIDRHPEAFDRQGRLVARGARFLLDRNLLQLRGHPQLQRWSRSFDPFAPPPRGLPELVVTVHEADWEPGSGQLSSRGPVRAWRRPEGSSPQRPAQTLTAPQLAGNTIQQTYSLQGPVQMRDPQDRLSFDGADLRVQVKEERLSSDRAFVARRGNATVRGDSLLVRGRDTTIEIASGCRLEQPGEMLRARRCLWNWSTQAIEAEGDLLIERTAGRQSVRGAKLKGRLGPTGQLEVSNPGARVVSRFQVPSRRSPAPVQAKPRRGPEPIRL